MALDATALDRLAPLLRETERRGVQGLSFQHVELCPTRAWLHYHRLDCGHLNRHMQLGLLLHERGDGAPLGQGLHGLAPDRVDWRRREISEIKKSHSHESALVNQLLFYLAAMSVATGHVWRGVLRYTASRRTRAVALDAEAIAQLQRSWQRLEGLLSLPRPPAPVDKPVCRGCSYRLLCWGQSTDDEET